ncbi:glycoside hydrolase family 16 protein, partial [Lactarius akahatsu]
RPPISPSRPARYTAGTVFFTLLLSLFLTLLPFSKDEWIGDGFFEGWRWETTNDPTHGRVNFVDQAEALIKNLTYADGGKFIMRADDWSIVDPLARGRDSIRILSNNAYDEAIIVLDLQHMPAGSKLGPWPHGGEIDIIEGVNDNTHNQATLHTAPNCRVPRESRLQTGILKSVTGALYPPIAIPAVNFNAGCGVEFSESRTSYGDQFNLAGGGYFVMYKGRDSVKVWFFPRGHDVPEVIRDGAQRRKLVYPDFDWDVPAANFPFDSDQCDYEQHFDAHQIVFDLTFCGDWAGSAWSNSGCGTAGECVDFVNNNPSEFAEAFWEINSLRVYTPQRSW